MARKVEGRHAGDLEAKIIRTSKIRTPAHQFFTAKIPYFTDNFHPLTYFGLMLWADGYSFTS